MEESKLIKIFPAFKVSTEMHEAVSRYAKKHHRKMMDQVRHLIERGIEAEEGHDTWRQQMEADIQTLKAQVLENKHEESRREILARQQRGKPRQMNG